MRDLERRLKALGFTLEELGGGCVGWARQEGERHQTIVHTADKTRPRKYDSVNVSLVGYEHGEPLWLHVFSTPLDAVLWLENPAHMKRVLQIITR